MKKPPDNVKNFITVKVPLRKVLKNWDLIKPKFDQVVIKINQFATRTYEFLNMYILWKFQLNQILPKIDKSLILRIFNLIGQRSSKGRKSKVVQDDIQEFYQTHFEQIYPSKIDKVNLTYPLALLSEEIIKCLETNIKTHFIDYCNKYINIVHRNPKQKIIKESKKSRSEKKVEYSELNKCIRAIKNDFINLEITKSDPIYHPWLETQYQEIFTFTEITNNLAYDVKIDPQRYLLPSLIINKKIEELTYRPFQVIPQRTFGLKNITLNTSGLVEVLADHTQEIYSVGYSDMKNNTKQYQKHAWIEVLKLENRGIFQHPHHVFYNQIQTDGVSCSLLFIRKEYQNKTYGQKMPKDLLDDLYIEKLTDLTNQECNKITNIIGVDPGKRALMTMVNSQNKFYSVTNARRRVETGTKRSSKILLAEKELNGLKEFETKLSQETKRTIFLDRYTRFVNVKQNNPEIEEFYIKELWRKLALKRYIKTQSFNHRILNEISQNYGSDVVIGLGNWSNNCSTQLRGSAPSLNRGLYKILSTRFQVQEVDEFRTSKLYNLDTSQELVKLKVRGKSRHALLTPKGKPNGVIINRDNNACKNILSICRRYLKNQTRPKAFSRLVLR
jgi:hypothetical protein